MPLAKGSSKKSIASRFHELTLDNKKSGKARGANGKPRSRKQIIAIALGGKGKKKKQSCMKLTKVVSCDSIIEDTPVVRSYIPRSQKMIAWIEANRDDIDNLKNGNVEFSFSKEYLKIKQEFFTQL